MSGRRKTSTGARTGLVDGIVESVDARTVLDRSITESEFQRTVVEAATALNWIVVHFPNTYGNPIWPDLTLIRGGRIIFAELKREDGTLSRKQRERLWELANAGMTVHVWKPSMWESIEATLKGA